MTALLFLTIVYLWCLIGDLLFAINRWGYPEDRTVLSVLFWPNRIWWTVANLIHDWRADLYQRTKHY